MASSPDTSLGGIRPDPVRRGGLEVPLFVALVAVLSHAWVLSSPFRADDWTPYLRSSEWLAELGELAVSFDADSGGAWRDRGSLHRGNYRPIDWTLRVLESALWGRPDALRGHALALGMHALCAAIVALLGRALAGRAAGCLAGVFVAANPAGFQALTFTASRGDVLVGLFAALSVWASLPRRTTRTTAQASTRENVLAGLLAGTLAVCALSSKVTGLLLAPLPFLCLLFVPVRRSTCYVLPAGLMLGLGHLLRYRWLGDLFPLDYRSPAAHRLTPGDVWPHLANVPDVGEALAASTGAVTGPLRASVGGGFLDAAALGVVVALALLALRRLRRSMALLVWLAVASLPAIAVWQGELLYDRVLYSPAVPLALLMGLGAAQLLKRSGVGALTLAVLTTVLLAAWGDTLWALADVERRCVEDQHVKSAQLRQLLAEDPERYLVVDAGDELHCGQMVPTAIPDDPAIVRGNQVLWQFARSTRDQPTLFLRSPGVGQPYTVEGTRQGHRLSRLLCYRKSAPDVVEADVALGDGDLVSLRLDLKPGPAVRAEVAWCRDGLDPLRESLVVPGSRSPRTLLLIPPPEAGPYSRGPLALRVEAPQLRRLMLRPPRLSRQLDEHALPDVRWESPSLVVPDAPSDATLYRATILFLQQVTVDLYWLPDPEADGHQRLRVDEAARSLPFFPRGEVLPRMDSAVATIVSIYGRDRTLTSAPLLLGANDVR